MKQSRGLEYSRSYTDPTDSLSSFIELEQKSKRCGGRTRCGPASIIGLGHSGIEGHTTIVFGLAACLIDCHRRNQAQGATGHR